MSKIKKTIAILLIVLFIATVTASAVSAIGFETKNAIKTDDHNALATGQDGKQKTALVASSGSNLDSGSSYGLDQNPQKHAYKPHYYPTDVTIDPKLFPGSLVP